MLIFVISGKVVKLMTVTGAMAGAMTGLSTMKGFRTCDFTSFFAVFSVHIRTMFISLRLKVNVLYVNEQ